MTTIPKVGAAQRRDHLKWLLEVTAIPTAAGREERVIAWVERWLAARPALRVRKDRAGNLSITRRSRAKGASTPRPLLITAHLDHPAFVVLGAAFGTVELEFRGGVLDAYFPGAAIEIIDSQGQRHPAEIIELDARVQPFKRVKARLSRTSAARRIAAGDIGRWRFPRPKIHNGILHTNACDDLAAVAAALAALDVLHRHPGFDHVGVLLTRAEEIGFVGAIAACRFRTVSKDSRLICLENSRSFADSPIGAGPILRVGDRMSVFEPTLTNRLTDIMLEHAKSNADFKWQRKLMPGGTCEATAFSSFGYRSTCICLPLGNYHNMHDIDGVNAGRTRARVRREHISVGDYHGLIEMLLICAARLDSADIKPLRGRMNDLLRKHRKIIGLR